QIDDTVLTVEQVGLLVEVGRRDRNAFFGRGLAKGVTDGSIRFGCSRVSFQILSTVIRIYRGRLSIEQTSHLLSTLPHDVDFVDRPSPAVPHQPLLHLDAVANLVSIERHNP